MAWGVKNDTVIGLTQDVTFGTNYGLVLGAKSDVCFNPLRSALSRMGD